MVLQAKKQWSTKCFKVNHWCFPIKQVEVQTPTVFCYDTFCALKVLKRSRLVRKHNTKKKNKAHVFSSVTCDIKQVVQDLQAEMRPGLLFAKRAEGLLCFFSVIANIQPHTGRYLSSNRTLTSDSSSYFLCEAPQLLNQHHQLHLPDLGPTSE